MQDWKFNIILKEINILPYKNNIVWMKGKTFMFSNTVFFIQKFNIKIKVLVRATIYRYIKYYYIIVSFKIS